MSQIKDKDKAMAGDLSETDISNTPDGAFKAKIIRIFTRLERTVEDISETFNTEVDKNQSNMN